MSPRPTSTAGPPCTWPRRGFVALVGAGTTQFDGFDDCTEAAYARGGSLAGLVGFCYYTRQDAERARDTGYLSLAFWGAPDGSTRTMEHAGGSSSGRSARPDSTWTGTARETAAPASP
ncbi:hypothetical protein NRF20_24445 [Streptomyces sp. R-74717]|uniref:DUF6891 domain-containing protein n=1 Tax=Streptomyces sp. R-74717 TaxID=2969820 RepID=UPI0039B58FFB